VSVEQSLQRDAAAHLHTMEGHQTLKQLLCPANLIMHRVHAPPVEDKQPSTLCHLVAIGCYKPFFNLYFPCYIIVGCYREDLIPSFPFFYEQLAGTPPCDPPPPCVFLQPLSFLTYGPSSPDVLPCCCNPAGSNVAPTAQSAPRTTMVFKG
jgi:hypothetical protein